MPGKVEVIQADILRVQFWNQEPAKGSEYWVFCGPAATIEGLLALPSRLGVEWAWQANELVVDFVDGPDSGQVDLVSWSEFEEIMEQGHLVIVRWGGLRLPLRVLVYPGLGVRIAIEHLDELEFLSLHENMVGEVVPIAIEEAADHAVCIGCDTRGVGSLNPEGFFGYRGESSGSIQCSDYVFGSNAVVGAVQPDTGQEVRSYGDFLLISDLSLVPTKDS